MGTLPADYWEGSPARDLLAAVVHLGAMLDEHPEVLPAEFVAALNKALDGAASLIGQQQGTSARLTRTVVFTASQR